MVSYWIITHLGVVATATLDVFAVGHIVRQRRAPASALAWLLTIVLLPLVGVLLYATFGARKVRRIEDGKDDLTLPEQDVLRPAEANMLDRLMRNLGIPGATHGNRVGLCTTGEETFGQLTEIIGKAERSIWITTFILHADDVGRDIVSRLARRAAEGLDVRLILDAVGSFSTRRHFLRELVDAGGHAAFFMPVLHRPFRGRTNLRNHRKIAIADGRRVLAGGTNIASEYIGRTPRADRWRDLSFTLTGPAVLPYVEIFRLDWEFASDAPLARPTQPLDDDHNGPDIVQVVPSGPDVPQDALYAALVSAAFAARERLWIVTPYFVPDDALAGALKLAAQRGVDVRILLPEKSNHFLADLARGTYLRELQEAGGRVLLYTHGMVHAKCVLVDAQLAIIGSANLDMRSLYLNYEVALFIYTPAEVERLAAWFVDLAAGAQEGIAQVGPPRDLIEGAARLLAPLL